MEKKKVKMLAAVAVAMMFFAGCSYPDDTADSGGGGNSSPSGGSSSSGRGSAGYIFEDFEGSGTPTGWTYNNFSSITFTDDNVRLRGDLTYETTASVTTSLVAMGVNPVLSFKYRVSTNGSGTLDAATDNALQYTIFISTDNGTTWTSLNGYTDVRYVSSASFTRVHIDLSAYANRTINVRITFSRITNAYVWLDDVALGTVPPIFTGVTTMAAETVYNNYSSTMSINTRTYRITNNGSIALTFNGLSTTGGITIIGLPTSLGAFDTTTITVVVNASSFGAYSAYNGSFSFNTNDSHRPLVTVNVTGNVIHAPEGDSQDFEGSGTPTGWTYNNFSSITFTDDNVRLRGDLTYGTTASVTTSLVAMGANPVLSFKYRVSTNGSGTLDAAANGALLYTVSVSADDGVTWTNVLIDVPHVSSADFKTITANLPSTYAKQVIRTRITFARVTNAYVWLDDVAMN